LVVVATSLSLPVRHALPSPTTEFCGSFEEWVCATSSLKLLD
jgi:hypothetical protein